jgi:proteasome lid subunit RPN8/RPN11
MREHASEEYPSECCGLLTDGPQGIKVHPCENIQDTLHAKDPQSYPRGSRIAYYIDPQKLYDIVKQAETAGGGLLGIYHSHVDTEAYFSDEDKERAMVWDEPAYPGVAYVVFSVYQANVTGYKCFAWSEGECEFLEVGSEEE